MLVHGHHVGVALYQVAQVALADGLLGLEESEEFLALAVYDALGRVEVLHVDALGGSIEHASAESCHASAHGEDGPYHTSAKAVAQASVLVLQTESRAYAQPRFLLVDGIYEIAFLVAGL